MTKTLFNCSLALLGFSAALFVVPAMAAEEAHFSDGERTELGEIIRSYLIENPGVLIEAMQALQVKEASEQQAKAAKVLRSRHNDVFKDGYSFSAGAPDAKVTIVEFFDYNCGFCRKALDKMMAYVDSNPDVRVVFKEFPVLGDASNLATLASMAAADQGKYLEFHRNLMGYDGRISQTAIDTVAEDIGLDLDKLHTDMKKKVYADRIEANHQLADDLGLTGTPSFVVGERVLSGWSEDDLEQMIEEARGS